MSEKHTDMVERLFGIRRFSRGIVAMLTRALFVLLLCATLETPALAGACSFGIWKIGDQCQTSDGRTCEVIGYPVNGKWQFRCTSRNTGEARPPTTSSKREHVNCAQTADPDRSISACTAMLNDPSETRSNKLVAHNNRCLAYYQKHEYDRAIADCDQAIRLNSNYAIAYNNRCLIYRSKQEYDRAIVDCNQSIKLNPKYAVAYINRCSAYLGKHEYSRAVADCDEAISLNTLYSPNTNHLLTDHLIFITQNVRTLTLHGMYFP
jgi:tetratricopeptide (TPR) repeat protein